MGHDRRPTPLALVAALTVVTVALLAGSALWLLHRIRDQYEHAYATQSVLDLGSQLAIHLAAQDCLTNTLAEPANWHQFSALVNTLYTLENGLQYVAVRRDGVVVFQEHTCDLESAGGPRALAPTRPEPGIRIDRKRINLAGASLPVITFAQDYVGEDGRTGTVEIALLKDTVTREERNPQRALRSMFQVALALILVAFGGCLGLVLWIMRRERRREQAQRAQEHLAFSGVLANGIVHDFRNPMSAVRLDTQMLQKEAGRGPEMNAERVRTLADRIRQTMDRMDKIFQEFLYLSRPVSEACQAVDLPAMLREIVEMLGPRFEQGGVRPDLRLPAEPVMAWGYPNAMRRAILNVVLNAEQFSPRGASVGISLRVTPGRAVLEILDAGPGIPAGERKRIFDLFVSSRPGGTGLGLFLARTGIAKCGGTITADNRPEGGACFRIELPLARASMIIEPG